MDEAKTAFAWGDESIRIAAPTPTYLMAATVLREDADTARLETLKPKKAAKASLARVHRQA